LHRGQDVQGPPRLPALAGGDGRPLRIRQLPGRGPPPGRRRALGRPGTPPDHPEGERRRARRALGPRAGAARPQGRRRHRLLGDLSGARVGRAPGLEPAAPPYPDGMATQPSAASRTLTVAGREVVRIGLGTNRLRSTLENHAFLREAVEAGLGLIDTAHVYTDGDSERTIGEALTPDGVAVATKGGYSGTASAEELRAQIEQS